MAFQEPAPDPETSAAEVAGSLVKAAESCFLAALKQDNPSVFDEFKSRCPNDVERGAAIKAAAANLKLDHDQFRKLTAWMTEVGNLGGNRAFVRMDLLKEGVQGACWPRGGDDFPGNGFDGVNRQILHQGEGEQDRGKLAGTPLRRRARARMVVPADVERHFDAWHRASPNPYGKRHQEKQESVEKGKGRSASAKTDRNALRRKFDARSVGELMQEADRLGITNQQKLQLWDCGSDPEKKDFLVRFILAQHERTPSRAPSRASRSQDGGESLADSVGSRSVQDSMRSVEASYPEKQELTGRLKRRSIPQGGEAREPKAKAARSKPAVRPPSDQEDEDGDGRLSVMSQGSKASGRGRSGQKAKGQGKRPKKQEPQRKPPPPSTPPPVAAAARVAAAEPAPAAAAAPSIAASSNSGDLPNPDFLLTQQAKDRLQHKIDMLNDNQLEQVLDFLEADLANDPSANPDEEIQLDLDRLALPKMVNLVRLIDGILDEEKNSTTPSATAAAAAQPAAALTSTQQPAPPDAAAGGAAQPAAAVTSTQGSPQEAAQNNFVPPEGTSSPRLGVPGPSKSPSVVGAWSEYNARLDTHESRKQAARSSIEPAPVVAAPAASASQAPAGSDSLLHDADEIVGMMD